MWCRVEISGDAMSVFLPWQPCLRQSTVTRESALLSAGCCANSFFGCLFTILMGARLGTGNSPIAERSDSEIFIHEADTDHSHMLIFLHFQ
jgi:hypothetical protein